MSFSKKFSALPLLLFTAIFSFGQISSQDNQACNPEFARLLVEQQVSEGKTVEETDKRVKILLRSADFLWKFDEPTARKYFSDAFKIAADRFAEKGFEEKKIGDKERSITSFEPDYRLEVIRAVAKRDGEWAKRLTDQILTEYEKTAEQRKEGYDKTREIGDLLGVAQENLKTNPNLSRYLFRRVMRYRLDSHWYWTLYSMAKENPQAADALYVELLQNYAGETPRRLLFLSAYPFAASRIFGADKFQYGASVPANLSPNLNLQRQFIETFFRRVAAFANNPDDINRPPDQYRLAEAVYIFTAFEDIEPFIAQNFPNLLRRFADAKAQADSLMSAENRKTLEERRKTTENLGQSFEERLKLLEKADEEGKLSDFQIINLITWGDKTEAQFQAAQPWLDKIKDENVRLEATNYFYFLWSKLAVKENRLDEARKFAEKVVELEHRAILYFEIADAQLKNIGETAKVLETLGEVSKLARRSKDSVAKAQVLLGLANAYEKANHTIALNELSEAVNVINRLEKADIFSASVYRQIIGKDFAFYAVFNTPGYNLETTFGEIGKKDFELSLANAKNLSDKYFRTLAVLAVAKNCVQNLPKIKTKP